MYYCCTMCGLPIRQGMHSARDVIRIVSIMTGSYIYVYRNSLITTIRLTHNDIDIS